jgi:hypothetical protein
MIKVSIEPPKERIVTIQMTEGEAERLTYDMGDTCGIRGALYKCLCDALNEREENL